MWVPLMTFKRQEKVNSEHTHLHRQSVSAASGGKVLRLFKKNNVATVDCQICVAQGGGSENLMTRGTKVQAAPQASSVAISVKEPANVNDVGDLGLHNCYSKSEEVRVVKVVS